MIGRLRASRALHEAAWLTGLVALLGLFVWAATGRAVWA